MKSKKITKKLWIFVIALICVVALVGCKKDDENKGNTGEGGDKPKPTYYYDNENDALVFSSQAVDKVFNPFFSTSGADSNVIGMTQLGMLSNDPKGNYTYGDKEAAVTKDLEIFTEGTTEDNTYTTYYFVLKNNVRFSNGSYLTIKDVLFNLYVYLDPVYTGSSTIYSTDIVGLKEYRTQQTTEEEQKSFKDQFETNAKTRITALSSVSKEILKNQDADFRTALLEYATEGGKHYSKTYENVVKDYDKAVELFRKELQRDYNNSKDQYGETVFTDSEGTVHKGLLTTDVEVFLLNEGYLKWVKKEGKLESSLVTDPKELKTWTEEQAINTIVMDMIPDKIVEIINYWATSTELFNDITNEEMEKYYANGASRQFNNISGIKFANQKEAVVVNNVTYDVPEYENGVLKEGSYEVLSIKIKGVDPKAIWNFSFGVAPMYYYSDEEHIKKFDFESNFGVEYASSTFMNKVVNNPNRIGVPVGAGAYAASKSSGGITNIKAGDFYDLGVIYYERNPYFLLGPAKIKKVRFQVVAENQMLNSLYSKSIDFVEPNAKPETIEEIANRIKKGEGLGYQSIETSGYGYIGINASKVKDLEVRQAIMHAIDTKECVNYYHDAAQAVYRSMSRASWAYPKDATPYYPYVGDPVPKNLDVVNPAYAEYVGGLGKEAGDKLTAEEQRAFIEGLVESAGYEKNANDVYQKGNTVLKFTFTIAGQETDHPAYAAMLHAKEILNESGFQVEVKTDANALKKLSEGSLTVWAAAWGSTIDPDMYQVYHKDSSATSVKNWGYQAILQNNGGEYDEENYILDELSEYIEKARKTNKQSDRIYYYDKALTLVMQLAIELPTYQRNDLFAYNANKLDSSTLTSKENLSPYKGLTSELWNVSLIVEK